MPIGPHSTEAPPKTDRNALRKRRSILRKAFSGIGWLAAGPVDWLGLRTIRRNASFIGGLASQVRDGPGPDPKFRTAGEGRFDVRATAFLYGVSEQELEHRLAVQRRETARMAYVALAFACAFGLAWLWQALSSPLTAARLTSTIEFLPFFGLFLLMAFHNALLNFQLRIGRRVSWREYLRTDLPFLPR